MSILGKMERPLRLVLIRHAESLRNKAKPGVFFNNEQERRGLLEHAYSAQPLTEKGWRQARSTGRMLRTKFGVPDCIYHSGFRRTVDTTAGILEGYEAVERDDVEVLESAFVRERDTGYTYNMTLGEVNRAFPWLQECWRTYGPFYARPPGGESYADVVQRLYLFLDRLFQDRAGQTVFVVTHGGATLCFRYLLERWTEGDMEFKEPPDNCGVTVYGYSAEKGRMVLEEYNSVYWLR